MRDEITDEEMSIWVNFSQMFCKYSFALVTFAIGASTLWTVMPNPTADMYSFVSMWFGVLFLILGLKWGSDKWNKR